MNKQKNKQTKIMHEPNEFNKTKQTNKKYPTPFKILPAIQELRNTTTDWNNSIKSFSNRLSQAEKRITEFDDRSFKIIQ